MTELTNVSRESIIAASTVATSSHAIETYTGKNKPLAGQQLITYTFRKVKAGSELIELGYAIGTAPTNCCISAPFISTDEITANLPAFIPVIQDAILEARKLILKDAHLGKKTSLPVDALSISAVITKLQETSSGEGRFSKAVLKDWFEAVAMEGLAAGVMTKLGITADTPEDAPSYKQLEDTLNAVLDFLASFLFAKKGSDSSVIEKVESIVNRIKSFPTVTADDEVIKFFDEKLEVAKKKPAKNLLDLL